MVPVGGSIVASIVDAQFIDELATIYPGRASVSPILDLFITLLEMGKHQWNKMRRDQEENMVYFKELLTTVFGGNVVDGMDGMDGVEEEKNGVDGLCMIRERVLFTPDNPISIGLTLNSLYSEQNGREVTKLGSMLFSRCVSGARIVVPGMKKKVGPFEFENYGGHFHGGYHSPYVTITSSIGMTKHDINEFVHRMLKCYHRLLKVKGSRNENIMKDHMLTLKGNDAGKGRDGKKERKRTLRVEDPKGSKKRSSSASKSKSKTVSKSSSKRNKPEKRKDKERRNKDHRKRKGKAAPLDIAGNRQRMLYLVTGMAVGGSIGVILTRQIGRDSRGYVETP